MNITKVSNEYIKIESDYINDVIANPQDYDSIEITGTINCCKTDCNSNTNTVTIPVLENNQWMIDLSEAVYLNGTLQKMTVQNLTAFNTVNVLLTPIELSYVEDNCSEPTLCTLETFSVYFSSLFKNSVDAFFATIGLITNVSVTITGNVVTIGNLPPDWGMYNAEWGYELPYTLVPFGFNNITSTAFLGTDGIYIPASFFSMEELESGIYHFSVKIYKSDGASYIYEENCAFIDIDIKCKVAALLSGIISEANNSANEKISTMVHLLHYGLVNGSNCGCNCDQMCEAYRTLYSIIKNTDPSTFTDCGCN